MKKYRTIVIDPPWPVGSIVLDKWESPLDDKYPTMTMRAIEAKTEAPRLEMFARAKRKGWDVWGNEVESDIEIGVKPQ